MDRNTYAVILGATEASLGSLLHALHVPFRGFFLSLNQGFFLLKANQEWAHTRKEAIQIPRQISIAAAGIKALGPIGKKATPILAILMQGFLFSLSQAVFGPSLFASILGIWLMVGWSFAQSALLAWLFLGSPFFQIVHRFSTVLVGVSIGMAFAITAFGLFLTKLSPEKWNEWAAFLEQKHHRLFQKQKTTRTYALLMKWGYLFLAIALIATATQSSQWFWILMRVVGVNVLFALPIFQPLRRYTERYLTRVLGVPQI